MIWEQNEKLKQKAFFLFATYPTYNDIVFLYQSFTHHVPLTFLFTDRINCYLSNQLFIFKSYCC